MATRPIEIGPVGQQVAENIARLRARDNLKQQELAERLQTAGRPITASALSKVEQCDRRVDVDDLMALAICLYATPNQLLLPPEASQERISLTAGVTATAEHAWQWAAGERLLEDEGPPDAGELLAIIAERRPHRPVDMQQALKHGPLLRKASQALKAVSAATGMTLDQVSQAVNLFDLMTESWKVDDDAG